MADINLASARAICLKCGISDELSQEIVRTRRRYGPFRCLQDLWNVKGMSNVVAGILESMYNINNDPSTRRSPTKNVYPRISRKGRSSRSSERERTRSSSSGKRRERDRSPPSEKRRGRSKSPSLESRRRRSRSGSRHGKRVSQNVPGGRDGGELVSVAVVDVNGQEHSTQAKTVHMEQSPSGNKLYIKCEGVRKYQILDASATEESGNGSATTVSNGVKLKSVKNAYTDRNRWTGVEVDPISFSKDRDLTKLREDFSKTEVQFWNRIDESRRELETCAGQLRSYKGKQTANWVCSLPNNMQENARDDSVFEATPLNLPGPSNQHHPHVPIKRHHHHPHRHRKEKSRKREEKDKKRHQDNEEAEVCIIL